MIKKALILILILIQSSMLRAQWESCDWMEFKDLMQSFNQNLIKDAEENLSFTIQVLAFENYQTQDVMESERRIYNCHAGVINLKLNEELQIQDDSNCVIINYEDSTLILTSPLAMNALSGVKQLESGKLDTLFKVQCNRTNDKVGYSLIPLVNGKIRGAEYWFESGQLVNIINYVNMALPNGTILEQSYMVPRIEMKILEYSKGAVDPLKLKKIEDILVIVGDEIVPTAEYKKFELIDLR